MSAIHFLVSFGPNPEGERSTTNQPPSGRNRAAVYMTLSPLPLRHLRLFGLPLRVTAVRLLNRSLAACGDTMQAMSFVNCGITDAGFRMIASSLKDMPALRALQIAGCELTDESGPVFTDILQANALKRVEWVWAASLCGGRSGDAVGASDRGLRIVELQRNKLGDRAAECLARALKMDTSILRLDLSDNQIGKMGATHLKAHTPACPSESLSLQ